MSNSFAANTRRLSRPKERRAPGRRRATEEQQNPTTAPTPPKHARSFSLILILATLLATVLVPTPPAQAAASLSWTQLPGSGRDIAVGANGAAWKIGTAPVPGGYDIARWNAASRTWTTVPGGAVRIAVGPDGTPWVVNSGGVIYRLLNNVWQTVGGLRATDIAVGGNGAVWVTSTTPVPGGYDVYQWTGTTWVRGNGGAVRVAVGSTGIVWLVNSGGQIFRRYGTGWLTMPGSARDIGAGTQVWIVGTNPVSTGYGAKVFDGVNWVGMPGGITQISVAPGGNPWAVNPHGALFQGRFSGFSQRGCGVDDVDVHESSSAALANGFVEAGESVTIAPSSQTIWAGVLFTGENGPEGWTTTAPAGYPAPGARIYSLLAAWPIGSPPGSWSYFGAETRSWTNTSGSARPLWFRTNDNVPGNGSGAFHVTIAHGCRYF